MTGKTREELSQLLLSYPNPSDSKYSRGTVGFVTGSEKYPGAALLGINAAFALGIGMVRYLGPKSVTDLVLSNRPEVVPGLGESQAVVLGSGISRDEPTGQLENLQTALASASALVIDAGAMNQVDFSKLPSVAILTPHHGEARWLLARFGIALEKNEIAANPAAVAAKLANLTGQVVLLKGHVSFIAAPGLEPISTGPGSVHLATAGTGDILAGMIGALLAIAAAKSIEINHANLIQIALIANSVHSQAAELAASKGHFGASAVCEALSEFRHQ